MIGKWYHEYRDAGKVCRGITLFKWNNLQLELWMCPPNFSVGEHVHHEFDGNIILLIGNVELCKRVNGVVKSTGKHFRMLSIPRDMPHFFKAKSGLKIPTVFVNIERWKSPPTSGAIDFQKV